MTSLPMNLILLVNVILSCKTNRRWSAVDVGAVPVAVIAPARRHQQPIALTTHFRYREHQCSVVKTG